MRLQLRRRPLRADIFHYVSPVSERRYEAGPPGTGELEQTRHGLGRHSPRGFHLDVESSASHVQSENRGTSVHRVQRTAVHSPGSSTNIPHIDRLEFGHGKKSYDVLFPAAKPLVQQQNQKGRRTCSLACSGESQGPQSQTKKTCRVQNPDIPRACCVRAHCGLMRWVRMGLYANEGVRLENYMSINSSKHRKHIA